MCCAVEENAVAAILMHSSVKDLEMVIVGGQTRKTGGWLNGIQISGEMKVNGIQPGEVSWHDVKTELLKGREELNQVLKGVDANTIQESILDAFHVDRSLFVDEVSVD